MKRKSSNQTVGIDLGDRKHAVCVLDVEGGIVKQESIANSRGSLTALSKRYPRALMVTRPTRANTSSERRLDANVASSGAV